MNLSDKLKELKDKYEDDKVKTFLEFISSSTSNEIWMAYYDDILPAAYIENLGDKPSVKYISKCRKCGSDIEEICKTKSAYYHAKKRNFLLICDNCDRIEKEERNKKYEEEFKIQQEMINTLKNMPYKEYLQTTYWDEIKKKVLKRAKFTCQLCKKNKCILHVHHRSYEHRGEGWEEEKDLICLCEDCHKKFHDKT